MTAMKLSDYITALQELVERNGDLDIVKYIESDDYDNPDQGHYELTVKYDMMNNILKSVDRVLIYETRDGNKEYCSMNMKGYIDGDMEKVFVIEDRY